MESITLLLAHSEHGDKEIFLHNLNEIMKYLTSSGYSLYVKKLEMALSNSDLKQLEQLQNLEEIDVYLRNEVGQFFAKNKAIHVQAHF